MAGMRQGGTSVERVVSLITQQKVDEIEPLFNQLASNPNVSDSRKAIIPAIITILNGSHDKALGDDPALDYDEAAEVLFLIERLGG